ncbi:MAG: hypothetical protein GYA17_21570 [Chloroflexi bacterium]|jgi:hypothetical protein|nr:hypothetical protein [Anaerolineaceae bacterium]NMB90961.1 hypothetical protein [Chloroflexota bacterium]
MASKDKRSLVTSNGGFFQELSLRAKLILRLMKDRRVNPLLKVLPLGTLVYLLVPDLVIGPLDDAAVIWLGTYLFVELCPPEVVREHMEALRGIVPAEWHDPVETDDTVEGEYQDLDGN